MFAFRPRHIPLLQNGAFDHAYVLRQQRNFNLSELKIECFETSPLEACEERNLQFKARGGEEYLSIDHYAI